MFETDDFDEMFQVLSQFDFPEVTPKLQSTQQDLTQPLCKKSVNLSNREEEIRSTLHKDKEQISVISPKLNNSNVKKVADVSPKHTKRKIINSYFDHNSKRKFPGPAGLLTGGLVEPKDDSICQMELLSQDVDFTQNYLRGDLFECALWKRLLADVKNWDLHNIDSIKVIKQQALNGNLRKRKAQTVTAFVEAVDRSATDPLIILRDVTGTMKCTLHRDAWSTFSTYIVSEFCALVLWKPTVLTTGSAFKKHYLNITLSNILAIYSSAVLKEDTDVKIMPDGYSIVYEEDFTVIKMDSPQNLSTDTLNNDSAVNTFPAARK